MRRRQTGVPDRSSYSLPAACGPEVALGRARSARHIRAAEHRGEAFSRWPSCTCARRLAETYGAGQVRPILAELQRASERRLCYGRLPNGVLRRKARASISRGAGRSMRGSPVYLLIQDLPYLRSPDRLRLHSGGSYPRLSMRQGGQTSMCSG
ncbi:hypothetical protein C8Q76DRAFT_133398 [Earliella scabrosa]|nr:hypothetical protein C8Q76DRAFT_133398 [Earliella scabrosa]